MVRSVIPDSDEDSPDEAALRDFSSTAHPAAAIAGASDIPATTKYESTSTPVISTQDDVIGQMLLGTGSTDSAIFQQIYNQHQRSTDATLSTTLSQLNAQHQPPTIVSQPDSIVDIANDTQPLRLSQTSAISSSASSDATVKKLKRSKTTAGIESSFASTDTSKKVSPPKLKRAQSVSRYRHTIEGSSQDIIVDIEDTGNITNLSQTSKEYRKMDNGQNKQRDVYDFPGSSESTVITKKVPAKTTMDDLRSKTTAIFGKTGKIGRSRTMIAPSSLTVAAPQEKKRRDSDAGRFMDLNEKLQSSPPLVEQIPKRSLKENIQRKKEEKAAAMKQEAHVTEADDGHTIVVGEPVNIKTSVKTYGRIKRSRTSVAHESPAAVEAYKRFADDSSIDSQKKRKSDTYIGEQALAELPQAKRYQRSSSIAASPTAHGKPVAPGEAVHLSSSQVDPVDQVPDTIAMPTTFMPKPSSNRSTDTIFLVPATKSRDKISVGTAPNEETTVDSNERAVADFNVSVANANTSLGSTEYSIGHGYRGTPKSCFDSSEEKAEAASSVLKKVNELVCSPAAPPTGQESVTSSPLAISFDKGLIGENIVFVPAPTEAQREHYHSVGFSSDDEHALIASLPAVMSVSKAEKWSGASSTVANSTWKERNSDSNSGQRRAPTMEPLSSQPQPSSTRPNKRSKTVTESTTARGRGRSASIHSDTSPLSGGSNIVARPGRKRIGRSKTMANGHELAKSCSQPRRTYFVETTTTYEKCKFSDESPPSFSDANPGVHVKIADTQDVSAHSTKRKFDAVELNVIEKSQPQTSHEKSQEELDLEMARKLQEEIDKECAEPETRAKRRGAPPSKTVNPDPAPPESSQDTGLPPPEMYKPRLSSRRSKSLSAKADPSAVEAFIDALPKRGRKGKGKKAVNKQVITAEEPKTAEKETIEPTKKAAAINLDADTIVDNEAPKSFLSMEKPREDVEAAVKAYAVPKKIGRGKSKSSAPAAIAVQDEDAAVDVVAPQKRGRAAKALINSTDDSEDELMMDVGEELAKPKATAYSRGSEHKRTASIAASARAVPKFTAIVESKDDDDEEMPVKPSGRLGRAKTDEKASSTPIWADSNKIVDTHDDQGEDEAAVFQDPSTAKTPTPAPASEPAAIAPTPVPKPRAITRQKSAPSFKAPTITRNKSTSVETDVPQTPRKDKELSRSQELTPKSTPSGNVPHSPLRGGVVPLRVGLSRRTRLPSLLKIIRKDK